VVAAEFAHEAGEHVAAGHLRAVADYWNDRIETWCSTPAGQYVRLAADPDHRPTEGAIAPEFLELVRYGLRRPKDERIPAQPAGRRCHPEGQPACGSKLAPLCGRSLW